MSKITSSNYATPVAATYHSADTDVYSRLDSYTGFLQCLDVHNHRVNADQTAGLGVGRITSTAIKATANTGELQVITGGLVITDGTTQNNLLDITQNGATAYKCIGMTGATAASRYVGATTSGAPGSGTFATGDFIVAQDGNIWICTAGGSPGTWKNAGNLTGTVVYAAFGTTDPVGGFLCDGRAVSRSTYAALFAKLSTNYGTGDGSTTFNIPDLRDRVVMGADNMGTSAGAAGRASGNVALGNSSGEDTHTLTGAEAATSAHGHTGTSSTTSTNTTGVNISLGNQGGNLRIPADGFSTAVVDTYDPTDPGHSHTVTPLINNATAASAGSAHNNRQLNQIINAVIWQ